MKEMAIRTTRWTRSPRGKVLGVATGLAEWKGFPEDTTRLIVFLIVVFTSVIPGVLIYLLVALLLPEQKESDIIRDGETFTYSHSSHRRSNARTSYSRNAEDASFREKSDVDLEKEYEELKKKVESMESDVFDKEKEWDARFKDETKD